MKLTLYTEYSLRVLVHLAANPEGLTSISEIASNYGISHNHLMKIVQDLRKAGFVDAVRGRGGGIRLARAAGEISLGDVVRHAEYPPRLVDSSSTSGPDCSMAGVLDEAWRAFMATLDRYSLADVGPKD